MDKVEDLFFSQHALITLFSVTNKLQMLGNKYLKDITLRQMLAIPVIIHAPNGKVTISHIAKKLDTTKQNAKQIVDSMKKKGYLSIVSSERDKRAVNIIITSKGEKVFRKCSKFADEFLADIFCNFKTKDLEKFCKLLQKLYYFDDMEKNEEFISFNERDATEILKHHKNYSKRRLNNNNE